MSKVFLIVFVIFGTVVGSGFSSGKEIMIFFSRLGVLSYLYILLAGFGFFWLFLFFLNLWTKSFEKSGKFQNIKLDYFFDFTCLLRVDVCRDEKFVLLFSAVALFCFGRRVDCALFCCDT